MATDGQVAILDIRTECLTLNGPITTAADDKFCDIFPNFRKKEGMIFHENYLLTCLIFSIFEKSSKFEIVVCC